MLPQQGSPNSTTWSLHVCWVLLWCRAVCSTLFCRNTDMKSSLMKCTVRLC